MSICQQRWGRKEPVCKGLKLILSSAPLVLLLAVWQLAAWSQALPTYILPAPIAVAISWYANIALISSHAGVTLLELALSLFAGLSAGWLLALALAYWRVVARALLPLLLISQAIPVFALAPVLSLWLGYGLAPKIVMASLIIFFPVVINSYDGIKRTPEVLLMTARSLGASNWRLFWHVRVANARPQIASGIRIALVSAPIGVIVGEWIGSSAGLGYLMLHANARVATELMFAALFTLFALSLILYAGGNAGLRYWCRHH